MKLDPYLEKRRHFHPKKVRIPTDHCYEFISMPYGLFAEFPKARPGLNIFGLLNYLTRCMGVENRDETTGYKKDVAQTFWHRQSTLADALRINKKAISAAMVSLVSDGILVSENVPGKGTSFAFSKKAIEAWKKFSDEKTKWDEEDDDYDNHVVSTIPEVRVPAKSTILEVGVDASLRSGLTTLEAGTLPYIEERVKELSKLDGCISETIEPSRKIDVVTKAQRFDPLFSRKSKFITFKILNSFVAGLEALKGEDHLEEFRVWAIGRFPGGLKWSDDLMPKLYRTFENRGTALEGKKTDSWAENEEKVRQYTESLKGTPVWDSPAFNF